MNLKIKPLLRRETNLVAAKTKTPVKTSTPSNSVRNCEKGRYYDKKISYDEKKKIK